MKKIEKIYLYTSILVAFASLSLLLPGEYVHIIWDNGRSHMPSYRLVGFFLLSPILGILGIVLIVKAVKRKEDNNTMLIATALSASFFIAVLAKLGGG